MQGIGTGGVLPARPDRPASCWLSAFQSHRRENEIRRMADVTGGGYSV